MTAVPGEAVCAVAACAGGIRWLRVAQREHYLTGSVTRFARRWWLGSPLNASLLLGGLAAAALAFVWPLFAVATGTAVIAGPAGLTLRGRTSPLVWTRRLRTLAVIWACLQGLVIGIGVTFGAGAGVAALAALGVPLLVDLGCALTLPAEDLLARRHVDRAKRRLAQVRPRVVAITGSYGKTSTKVLLAHLLAGVKPVVVSPASFNNRAGLSRTVNEQLAPGAEVFVAEMGAYGPGEIADLCSWLKPDISVITAIGPVHLERFRSDERILAAKSEIVERASVAVLNADDIALAGLAKRLEAARPQLRVVRCSATDQERADVACVRVEEGLEVLVGGKPVARAEPGGVAETNLACAIAVALELGLAPERLGEKLGSLPAVQSRLASHRAQGGFTVIDDTYNSNPAGTRLALTRLCQTAASGGRRVVVTPGMVELGPRQASENESFARVAAEVADDLVIVGRTNLRSLARGASAGSAEDGAARVVRVPTRQGALAWVRDRLGPGDAVLYENDLPDHYP